MKRLTKEREEAIRAKVAKGYGCCEWDLLEEIDALRAEIAKLIVPEVWHSGYPDKCYASEWFIAKLDHGQKVVLRALPEEYSYDFRTADDTYYKKERIKCWMQFPDSEFIPFVADAV